MPAFMIRLITEDDRGWVKQFTEEHWGSDRMIINGEVVLISQMAGFVAELAGEVVGLITYRIQGAATEVTSLDSLREGQGIGTALIESVATQAIKAGCTRLHLTTTNDNLNALRFYQKRGFILSQLRCNAVTESRKLKPEIPLLGDFDIPLRDEIELEMDLSKPA